MKNRFFRITFLVLLTLAGAGMATWYFLTRRRVPVHAQCIPNDAVAVLSLNTRALAADLASGGHLFPGLKNGEFQDELQQLFTAIKTNRGSGVRINADVLGFLCRDGENAFACIAFQLKDSTIFGKLVRGQLSRQLKISMGLSKTIPFARIGRWDGTVGWNGNTALLVEPLGLTGKDPVDECVKLLLQKKENSILTDKNFCAFELADFDAGLWVNVKYAEQFTGGGTLASPMLHAIDYATFSAGFRKGQLYVHQEIFSNGETGNVPYSGTVLFPCDPMQVKGFWRQPLNLSNDSLITQWIYATPLRQIPFLENNVKDLCRTFDGNATYVLHDTISYNATTLSAGRDSTGNLVEIKKTQRRQDYATSFCAGLKNEKQAKQMVSEWAKEYSVPQTGNAWTFDEDGMPARLIIADNMLTITTWPQADGHQRPAPDEWLGLDGLFPAGEYFNTITSDNQGNFMFIPGTILKTFGEQFGDLTRTSTIVIGDKRSNDYTLTFKNKSINALVQLLELSGKAWEEAR